MLQQQIHISIAINMKAQWTKDLSYGSLDHRRRDQQVRRGRHLLAGGSVLLLWAQRLLPELLQLLHSFLLVLQPGSSSFSWASHQECSQDGRWHEWQGISACNLVSQPCSSMGIGWLHSSEQRTIVRYGTTSVNYGLFSFTILVRTSKFSFWLFVLVLGSVSESRCCRWEFMEVEVM